METLLVGMIEPSNKTVEAMMKERQGLLDLLARTSIPHRKVENIWPRDLFVSFKGEIYENEKQGRYADGGFIIVRDDFTLVCDKVSKGLVAYEEDDYHERFEKLTKLYGSNFHILPSPDIKLNQAMSPHIDLVLLPVPERKVLFADRRYNYDNPGVLRSLCRSLDFNLELVDHDYKNPSWPCNSVIVNHNGKLFALTNSIGNEDFTSRLMDYGIAPLAVPFYANCKEGGSLHCSTNTCGEDKIALAEKICKDYNVNLD